jgi:hypothetical protein
MIPHLPGWTKLWEPDALTLFAPSGAAHGVIRYRERLQPLQSLEQLVSDFVAREPGFVVDAIEPTVRFTTREGERGEALTMRGRLAETWAQRDLAIVTGELCYSRLTGVLLDKRHSHTFTQLIRGLATGISLGMALRRRRFEYDAPPGWLRRDCGLTTHWTPARISENSLLLTVCPAEPTTVQPEQLIAGMLDELRSDGWCIEATDSLAVDGVNAELYAQGWQIVARTPEMERHFRELVVLRDNHFIYPLTLESTDAELLHLQRPVMLDVARSIQPILRGTQSPVLAPQLYRSWCA